MAREEKSALQFGLHVNGASECLIRAISMKSAYAMSVDELGQYRPSRCAIYTTISSDQQLQVR